MTDYKKLYYALFNDVSDTIERLKEAQIRAEALFLETADCEDEEFPPVDEADAEAAKLLQSPFVIQGLRRYGIEHGIIPKDWDGL